MMQILSRLRRHRNMVWLLVSLLFLPLLQNLTSSWVEQVLGPTPGRLLQTLSLLIMVAIILWLTYVQLGKEQPLMLVTEERRPLRYPGLITLVSRRRDRPGFDATPAHEYAIRYHLDTNEDGGEPLRVCWLIASSGADGTIPEARRMRDLYGDRCRVIIKEVKDPFDLHETFALVRTIHAEAAALEHPLQPSQIMADFTGGTTPMSAGVVLACNGVSPMQYIQGGTDKIASMPVLVKMTN